MSALDGADQRHLLRRPLDRVHADQRHRRSGVLREPGHSMRFRKERMRFRKERSFVYSLLADGEQEACSPLEQITRAQVAQDALARFCT